MTSKIVVNNIEADSGISTVTFNSKVASSEFVGNLTGNVTSSGVTTVTSLRIGTGASISSPATNVLALGTNDSERVRIDSSGRVGIGTTNSSVARLFVSGGSISCNGSDVDYASGGNRVFIDIDGATPAARIGAATGGGTALPLRIIVNGLISQELTTGGLVRHPYQPYVMLGISANQSVSNATTTLINWDSAPYNLGSNFSLATDTFTAPVAGYYYVSLDVQFTNQVNQLHTGIWVNNTSPGTNFDVWCNHGDDTRGHNRSAIVYCAANDTIKLYCYHGTGSAQNLETNRTKATIRLIS